MNIIFFNRLHKQGNFYIVEYNIFLNEGVKANLDNLTWGWQVDYPQALFICVLYCLLKANVKKIKVKWIKKKKNFLILACHIKHDQPHINLANKLFF
jgi:hypothetical protein